jgi:hypothetical protein
LEIRMAASNDWQDNIATKTESSQCGVIATAREHTYSQRFWCRASSLRVFDRQIGG